jgi:hypothetical protein
MDARERLQGVQSQLEGHGVQDVKFFFKPGLAELPNSVVLEDAAVFLETYLEGRYTEVQKISESAQA